MVYLAIAELAVIVALVVRNDRAIHALLREHAVEVKLWAEERSELLTRAMHPQVIFPPARMQPAAPDEPAEPDQFELVGRILDGEE